MVLFLVRLLPLHFIAGGQWLSGPCGCRDHTIASSLPFNSSRGRGHGHVGSQLWRPILRASGSGEMMQTTVAGRIVLAVTGANSDKGAAAVGLCLTFLGIKRGFPHYKVSPRPQRRPELVKKHLKSSIFGDKNHCFHLPAEQ